MYSHMRIYDIIYIEQVSTVTSREVGYSPVGLVFSFSI